MNCKQAKRDIALWAGHDLDDPTQKAALRRHISGCPCCREHYHQMKRTLEVLERAERPVTYVTGDSLWPELASRISHARHRPASSWNTERFHGWMPLVAMTAACLILLLVVMERPQHTVPQIERNFTAPVISREGQSEVDRYRTFSDARSFEDQNTPDELRLLNELRRRAAHEGF